MIRIAMAVMFVTIAIMVRIAIAFVMMMTAIIVVAARVAGWIVELGLVFTRFQRHAIAGTHLHLIASFYLLQFDFLKAPQLFAAIRILATACLALVELLGLSSLKVSNLLFERVLLLLAGIRVLFG